MPLCRNITAGRIVIFSGIDPVKSGAVAVLDSCGALVRVIDMPALKIGTRTFVDGPALSEALKDCTHTAIELVSSRPGQGVASTFSFGQGFGGLVTLCSALTPNLQLHMPQSWQKHYGLKKEKSEKSLSKEAIAKKCLEIYPEAQLYGPRGGPKDGRSDAIIIARFALNL
jgi:crossover junction endodeoxyribonuclease RuvC